MAFDQIYAAELARLHSLGHEFATENPTIASYLSGSSGDPDVERLLQGFAFLTAMFLRIDSAGQVRVELAHGL